MEKNGGGWTVSDTKNKKGPIYSLLIRNKSEVVFKKIALIICTLFISFREKRRNIQE
jgi:hypothetical protein